MSVCAECRERPRVRIAAGIIETADALGVVPLDLAAAISYETAGSFDPRKRGPTTQWFALPPHHMFDLRRGNKPPTPSRPCHDVEVVEFETVRCAAGMVAARDADDIAILHRHHLIQRVAIGIDALDSPAIAGVQAVVTMADPTG